GCSATTARRWPPATRPSRWPARAAARYDFAYYREWGLILDGWSRPDGGGIDLARSGIDTLKAQNSFARMPYWLSLLADLLARNGQPGAARASLDAALSVGRAHDDVWWLPEVMRMRAAYDEEADARRRLRSAARLAAGHGSIALLQRCEDDLGRRGANGGRTEQSLRSACTSKHCTGHHAPEGHAMTASATETGYEELAAAIRGDLIRPGDPGYDQARAVYNAMIDKHPQAIARVRDTADVIACVRFARARAIPISVRGGGHNAAGLGVGDDALVIGLSTLRGTTVSPDRRTVRADSGCTWGDVDHATVAFGMATPSGFLSSTGVAGLTLGGGIGYLSRRFGPDGRQPARSRHRARRRHLRHSQSGFPSRPVLGPAGRRRELRRRHLVHLPVPPHRRARHHHRRPGLLRPG
ncbi:MAG TPA: FAD-dependent oxidoreductase, partial [Streptosporangiaceae bacterium]